MAMLMNAAGNANQMYMMTDERQSSIAEYQARQQMLDAARNGRVQQAPGELRNMLEQRNSEELRSPSFAAMQQAMEQRSAALTDERTLQMQRHQGQESDQQAEMNRHTLGM